MPLRCEHIRITYPSIPYRMAFYMRVLLHFCNLILLLWLEMLQSLKSLLHFERLRKIFDYNLLYERFLINYRISKNPFFRSIYNAVSES